MKNLIKLLTVSMILLSSQKLTFALTSNNVINKSITSEPISDTLQTFFAEQQSEEVHIHWSTISDQTYSNFAVEMSTDGKDFFEIGNVKGTEYTANAGEFLYIHKQAVSAVTYYRLKQVSLDGTSKYSKTVKSETKKTALVSSVKIYPNPVSNLAEISFTFSEASVYIMTVADQSGKVVTTQTGTGVVGNNVLQINMENQIPGMYLMYITGSNGLSHVSKFIKD